MADLALSGAATRDDWCRAAGPQVAPELVCIIAAIGNEPSESARSSCDDLRCGLHIAGIARREVDYGRTAEDVGDDVDLVVWPPREMPMACAFAPLCRRGLSDEP